MKKYVPSWHDEEVKALSDLATGFFEREVLAHNETSLTAGSTNRDEMPISASNAGIREVRNGRHASWNRALPASMTARARSSLEL
ncbi:hypothetical protein [Rhodococcus jostii]|nr:hypothetical protein [Rhodococcus jostii]